MGNFGRNAQKSPNMGDSRKLFGRFCVLGGDFICSNRLWQMGYTIGVLFYDNI